jgi:predicted dehydrogenase
VVRIGVIGCGYWGPNLIRNFSHLKGSEVLICSDLNEERLAHMHSLYPRIETSSDFRRVVARSDVDAVVVATPPETHTYLTKEALRAGKHVFVEKPLATSAADGAEMVAAARQAGKVLLPMERILPARTRSSNARRVSSWGTKVEGRCSW